MGIAQLAKIDDILALQKKNYTIMREALTELDGVTFRRVPEGGVENYSFLNFFLPTEDLTQKAHKALAQAGVDSCFYWYGNHWHYINSWEHLRDLKSLGRLPSEIRDRIQDLNITDFSKSDSWMSRTISSLVKIGWTDDQIRESALKMKNVLSEVLKTVYTL